MKDMTRSLRVMRSPAALVSTLGGLLLLVSTGAWAQPPFPVGPFGRGGWSPWGGQTTVDWITVLALIAAAVFFVLWTVERRKNGPRAGGKGGRR